MNRARICYAFFLTFSLIHMSSADVLVSEGFDYDAGPIDEQAGGEGWFDSWLVAEALFETEFKLDTPSCT